MRFLKVAFGCHRKHANPWWSAVAWLPAPAVSVSQIAGHSELLDSNVVNKHPPPIWLLQEVGPAEVLALLRNAGTHCGW